MVKTTNQIINHKHTLYIAYCKGLHPNNYNIMFNVSKAINHWFDGFNPAQKAYVHVGMVDRLTTINCR